ncbi:polymorphic toxin-type HINT domain-containing protein [Streptomyces sp. NBC_01615]|uniref:polymorphic toxin-type HINT domain-containing protein n=1 Tax=Streptomyces sp. NBC_01615 TaxID=2975898 RepID=UPI003866B195
MAEDAAGCAVHSFIPSTGVRLADGTSKPISTVKIGDTVLATDPQTGVTAPEQVQNVIVTTTDKDFTTLTLETAPTRGPPQHKKTDVQTLTTTWHHPFWDATHHRWTDARYLTSGTKLRQADGTTVVIRGVRNFHQRSTTYDLTVGTLHTYYVLAGATPVLVQNCQAISDAEQIEDHVEPRHIAGGEEADATKSLFDSDVDLGELVSRTEGRIRRAQAGTGRVKHIIDAGRIIGTDLKGSPTSMYTVVRSQGHAGTLCMNSMNW